VAWSSATFSLMGAIGTGYELAELLVSLKNSRNMEPPETLRALEVVVAMGLVQRAKA